MAAMAAPSAAAAGAAGASCAAPRKKPRKMYAEVRELREVPADGQLLLRSLLVPPVDDQFHSIAQRWEREQKCVVAAGTRGLHHWPGHWKLARAQGGTSDWLANPAHVAGLGAVLEQLVVQRRVGALAMVRLFVATADAVLSSLGQPALPKDHSTEGNLRKALLRRCNVVQFALDPAPDKGVQRCSGAPTVVVWMANPVRFDDEQLVHIVNTVRRTIAVETATTTAKPLISAADLKQVTRLCPAEMRMTIEFLVSSLVPGSVAEGLGIPKGRQTSVRRHFTIVTLRRAAEIEQQAVVLAAECNPAHMDKAILYRVRQQVMQERLMREDRRAIGAATRDILNVDGLIAALRYCAGELGAVHKTASTAMGTPVDESIIEHAKGTKLGEMEKLLVAINGWLQRKGTGRTMCMRSLEDICPLAGIRFATTKPWFTKPRLGRHYCNSNIRAMREITVVFSKDAVLFEQDAKALYKCGAGDGSNMRTLQIDDLANLAPCHNSGNDVHCKVSLEALMVHEVRADALSYLSWDPNKLIPGYDVAHCFHPRPPMAMMLGHSHDCDPETTSRNTGDCLESMLRKPRAFAAGVADVGTYTTTSQTIGASNWCC
jgi:hypothetical protein